MYRAELQVKMARIKDAPKAEGKDGKEARSPTSPHAKDKSGVSANDGARRCSLVALHVASSCPFLGRGDAQGDQRAAASLPVLLYLLSIWLRLLSSLYLISSLYLVSSLSGCVCSPLSCATPNDHISMTSTRRVSCRVRPLSRALSHLLATIGGG